MKIIYLNCWHGQLKSKLHNFLLENSKSTDIYGLLEVTEEMFVSMQKLLSGFSGIYVKNSSKSGQCVFVRSNLEIIKSEVIGLRKQYPGDTGSFQKVIIKYDRKKFVIGVVHGKSRPGHKDDTKIRLKQSEIIISNLTERLPKILGGDFNLNPNTQSIKIIEDFGFENLIKTFSIKTTRNKISWAIYKNIQYFADYCFVSPDVKVKNFTVPNVEISDHEPLILEFEI